MPEDVHSVARSTNWCRARTHEVRRAIDAVTLVKPRRMSAVADSGVLRIEVGAGAAHVHARDNDGTAARASFPVLDAGGAPVFAIADTCLDALRGLPDGIVKFDLVVEDNEHVLKYSVGAVSGRTLTVDPGLTEVLAVGRWVDSDDHVVGRVPAGVLRAALDTVRPFLPSDMQATKVPAPLCTAMTFDESCAEWARGNGYLFGGNYEVVCYVQCPALRDCHVAVPRTVVPLVSRLLGRASGAVTIRRHLLGTAIVTAAGDVLSWATPATHETFTYPSLTRDQVVLWLPSATALHAAELARVHVAHNGGHGNVLMTYSAKRREVRFDFVGRAVGSVGLPVPVVRHEGDVSDFVFSVTADSLLRAVEHVRTPELQLRLLSVPPKPGKRGGAVVRTLEEFSLDDSGRVVASGTAGSHPLVVTRCLTAIPPPAGNADPTSSVGPPGSISAEGEPDADGTVEGTAQPPAEAQDQMAPSEHRELRTRTESLVRWFSGERLITEGVGAKCAQVNDARVLAEVFSYLDWIQDEVDGARFGRGERRAIKTELSGYLARMLAGRSHERPCGGAPSRRLAPRSEHGGALNADRERRGSVMSLPSERRLHS